MKKIALISPYFGRWPEWFPLYLETCRWNPSIAWLMFSDCGEPQNLPPNVRIIPMTLAGFSELASRKLKLDIRVEKPHKLCDFKLAYGHLFSEHLEGYDYFGFTDIDLLNGNLRSYLTEEMLSRDLVTFSDTIISGPMCLLKNAEHVRSMYELIPGFDEKIRSSKVEILDELNIGPVKVQKIDCPKEMLDRISIYAIPESHHTPYSMIGSWIPGQKFPREWIWRNGDIETVPDSKFRFPFFHFLNWKAGSGVVCSRLGMSWLELSRLVYVDPARISEGFRITPYGFHPLDRDGKVEYRSGLASRLWQRAIRARRLWIKRRRAAKAKRS